MPSGPRRASSWTIAAYKGYVKGVSLGAAKRFRGQLMARARHVYAGALLGVAYAASPDLKVILPDDLVYSVLIRSLSFYTMTLGCTCVIGSRAGSFLVGFRCAGIVLSKGF